MSDPAPLARFDADAPDADEVRESHVVLRTLKRVRALIVLVPLIGGLLAAASIGASKLWAEIPEREAVSPEATCWDKSVRPVDECPEPVGPFGLRWVFPSFRADDPRCERVVRSRRQQQRPLEFACSLRFDQRPVTVTYSVRTSLEQGLTFLQRRYGVDPRPEADGERLVFRAAKATDGVWMVTVAYAEHPFAVTVEAPKRRLRDDALAELVEFRPAEQIRVRTGQG